MSPQRILLTGASSGMGARIAVALAGGGHQVFAGMRNMTGVNAAKARSLQAGPGGKNIEAVEIDVTDDGLIASCVDHVLAVAGGIDVLVNCAGIMWTGTSEAFSASQFETMLQTNLVGPFRLYKAVLPSMRDCGAGLLITITSTCGRLIPPGFGLYCASKFGIEALTEAIGYEVADMGIDSVIIEPGAFNTGLISNQVQPEDQATVAAYGAMGRFDRELTVATQRAMALNPELYNPDIVAQAVIDLIDLPPGQRPQRVPVGNTGGVGALNDHAAKAQGEFLKALGLGRLARQR